MFHDRKSALLKNRSKNYYLRIENWKYAESRKNNSRNEFNHQVFRKAVLHTAVLGKDTCLRGVKIKLLNFFWGGGKFDRRTLCHISLKDKASQKVWKMLITFIWELHPKSVYCFSGVGREKWSSIFFFLFPFSLYLTS